MSSRTIQAELVDALVVPRGAPGEEMWAAGLRLTERRIEAWLDVTAEIAAARTPFDMMRAQRRFWQRAAGDYGMTPPPVRPVAEAQAESPQQGESKTRAA